MEIEYQNKYVITWCLDRDGPRICLRAVTRENQIRTIEILSENFKLEIEEDEIRDFLNIVSQLAVDGAKTQSVETSKYEASPVEKEQITETDVSPVFTPDIVEERVFSEAVPDATVARSPEDLDSSEIIQILKQSERTYYDITSSSEDDDSIEEKIPISHEIEADQVQDEPTVSESVPIQEISENFGPNIDAASFFQKSVSKSPLELLLEQDKDKEKIPETTDSFQVPEPEIKEESTPFSTPPVAYTPDDLQTGAFFSDFDTKRIVNLQRKPEPESEIEPQPEYKPKRVVKLSPAPKFTKKEPMMTDADRRAAIEKERSERRRRLWELTRGF